jgi:hypothetical protein
MAEHAAPTRKSAEPATSAKTPGIAAPGGYGELLNRRGEAAMPGYAQLLARRAAANATIAPIRAPGPRPVQLRPNRTGLPDRLKAGVEALSGFAMDDVRVHRNSPEPAGIGARAFARGGEIHLATGQERHLPHESWHVVQQKQGRVAATGRVNATAVNDSAALEQEADRMGARALSTSAGPSHPASLELDEAPDFRAVIQRVRGLHPGTAVMVHLGKPHYLPGYPARGMVLEDRGDTYLVHVRANQAVFAEEVVEPLFSFAAPSEPAVRDPAAIDASGEEESQEAEKAQEQLAVVKQDASKSYAGLAVALLTFCIALETLIDRVRGTENRRGNYASHWLLSQMGVVAAEAKNLSGKVIRDVRSGDAIMKPGASKLDLMKMSLQKHISSLVNQKAFSAAFPYGLNPRPMPIAKEYATLEETGDMVVRALFVLTATKADLSEYESYVLRGKKPVGDGASSIVTTAAGAKNSGLAGLGTGLATASAAYWGLTGPVPVLGSNILYVQSLWDVFHTANDMAIKVRQARLEASASQRQVIDFQMKVLRELGRGKIRKAIKFILRK